MSESTLCTYLNLKELLYDKLFGDDMDITYGVIILTSKGTYFKDV